MYEYCVNFVCKSLANVVQVGKLRVALVWIVRVAQVPSGGAAAGRAASSSSHGGRQQSAAEPRARIGAQCECGRRVQVRVGVGVAVRVRVGAGRAAAVVAARASRVCAERHSRPPRPVPCVGLPLEARHRLLPPLYVALRYDSRAARLLGWPLQVFSLPQFTHIMY